MIYRRYAGLFFSMCVDTTGASPYLCQSARRVLTPHSENELACLESIHLFVEILDTYFSHVCELDLVWHFHKARDTALRCRFFVCALLTSSRYARCT